MSAIGWYNGTVGPLDDMTVPMNDRAVYFGDGCYEACLAMHGRMFAIDRHIARFYRSLRLLSIPFEMSGEALYQTLSDCVAASGEDCAALYWQVSRATARRSHSFPQAGEQPNLLITVTPKTLMPAGRTMDLVTAEDVRYRMCHIKTLNLLPNVLANERARALGADEAVLVRDGLVTEGSHTNIHILKDGALITHPADEYILPGVTRSILLSLCEQLGVPVIERAFTKEALSLADEALITSSMLGVRRARTLDAAAVGGRDRETFQRLSDAYDSLFIREMTE